MGNILGLISNSIVLAMMLALTILFIYHKNKQNRPVQYLLLSLICGVIFAILAIFYELDLIESYAGSEILKTLYLAALDFQVLFFYLFLEKSRRQKPSLTNFAIVISLIAIHLVSYGIKSFYPIPVEDLYNIYFIVKGIGDIAFNLLPIYVFGIVGFPIYLRMISYTQEKKSKILFYALISVVLGYALTFTADILKLFNGGEFLDEDSFISQFTTILQDVGDIVPVIGLTIFMLIYALNLSYIYRLPFDHYLLMVTHRSGLVLMSIPFETKTKQIQIEENIFSGMLTAMRTVYGSVLDSSKPIQMIKNEDASIYMHAGKHITAVVATEQISGVLIRGLEIFVERFEATFGERLKDTPSDMKIYEPGKSMFLRIFPFLQRKV